MGTAVEEGGLPIRYGPDGSVVLASSPKETREMGGRRYLLEEAISCDFALVRAYVADEQGNLVFRASARNFNPLCAMASRVTIVEAENVVAEGEIDPDGVHLPGIFVQRVVLASSGVAAPIERRTTRPRTAQEA